jgi:DNA-binding MarR family transcriptional regulator
MALADGRTLPASQLAKVAGISASTASSHLTKLLDMGFVVVEPSGRYRYYRLANESIAELLESLARVAPAQPVHSLRDDIRGQSLRLARSCYDHLAGRLAICVMESLLQSSRLRKLESIAGIGELDVHYELTESGLDFLDELGLPARGGGRTIVRHCLDWSERRHHLAGSVGRALLDHFLERRWVERLAGSRVLNVTRQGQLALAQYFSIDWAARADQLLRGAHAG